MRFAEPMTMATDYLLAVVAWTLAGGLARQAWRGGQRSVGLWATGLVATGAAAAVGGTYHGFAPVLDPGLHRLLWRVTVLAIGTSSAFTLAGTLHATLAAGPRRWALAAVAAKLAAFAVLSMLRSDFVVAVVDYAVAMLAILVLEYGCGRPEQAPRRRYFLAGVLVSFGAAGLQQAGVGLHAHFNHNDLYHVIQAGALWLLYRGARRLVDSSGRSGG